MHNLCGYSALKSTMDVWEQIKQRLASVLTMESYQNWLAKTSLARIENDVIFVSVPDEATKEWIQEEYGARILAAVREMGLPYASVVYQTSSPDPEAVSVARPARVPEGLFSATEQPADE